MDHLISIFNAAANAAFAALLTWAVLTRRVRDGVVIKTGFIGMALGLWVTSLLMLDGLGCNDITLLGRARLLVNAGAIIVGIGAALHLYRGRRLSDLIDLTPARSP